VFALPSVLKSICPPCVDNELYNSNFFPCKAAAVLERLIVARACSENTPKITRKYFIVTEKITIIPNPRKFCNSTNCRARIYTFRTAGKILHACEGSFYPGPPTRDRTSISNPGATQLAHKRGTATPKQRPTNCGTAIRLQVVICKFRTLR